MHPDAANSQINVCQGVFVVVVGDLVAEYTYVPEGW